MKKLLILTLLCLLAGVQTTKAQEAYAVKSESGSLLAFYYDTKKSTRSGTTYALPASGESPGWVEDGSNASITMVAFDSSFANARPVSTYHWFFNFTKLKTIYQIKYLNTSSVTNMADMFSSCNSLTSIDLSNFNTANVTNMLGMFRYCAALESLDLSTFNTAKVTQMGYMFWGCNTLKTLDLSSFNTSNVLSMSGMFGGCSSLTVIYMDTFNTSKVQQMASMFYGCVKLTEIDIFSFNTASVTDMSSMFQSCNNLKTIIIGNAWSTSKVTSSTSMFMGCTSIVGANGTKYNASYVDKTYARHDEGTSNPGYMTGPESYAVFNTSSLWFYHDTKKNTRTGTVYKLNGAEEDPGWYSDGNSKNITYVNFSMTFVNARPTSTHGWFRGMTKLTSVSNMQYLNTSEVTDMQYMFFNCSAMESVDVSKFNTSKVTDMSYMFYNCGAMESIDVSTFNTSNVRYMENMFFACTGLTTLNLKNFNTQNVKSFRGMFYYCTDLTNLDISSFVSTVATNLSSMFKDCQSLTSIDLSNFSTIRVTTMSEMFMDCNELETIFVGDGWTTQNVTGSTNMFINCTKIEGCRGTTYDASHVDKDYAHVDGGKSNPGYLTKAGKEGYAFYISGILTFTYDDIRLYRKHNGYKVYYLPEAGELPGWYDVRSSVTEVRIYDYFADARPESTYRWFEDMKNITSVTGLDNLNTSAVTDMGMMFSRCNSLKSLNLSSFQTTNVTNMEMMFYQCSSLTDLNLETFKTPKVTNMSLMFYGCSNLKTIYVLEDWDLSMVNNSSGMFYGCTSLVGGKGTEYDASHVDKAYAHIDGGTANPGYFSAESYGLWIAGIEVCKANKDDVFGNGYVSYDPSTKMLSLKNGTTVKGQGSANDGTTGFGAGIYSEIDGLTIDVVSGRTYIQGADECDGIYLRGKTTIKGDGMMYSKGYAGVYTGSSSADLTIDGNVSLSAEGTASSGLCGYMRRVGKNLYYLNTLTVKGDAVVRAKGGGEMASVRDWKDLVLEDNHAITSPAGAWWSAGSNGSHAVCDSDGNIITGEWVVIEKSINYDLNNDGKVSTADIQIIINEMKKPTAQQDMKYDLNGDGKISTADIQIIINEMKK